MASQWFGPVNLKETGVTEVLEKTLYQGMERGEHGSLAPHRNAVCLEIDHLTSVSGKMLSDALS